MSRSIAVLIFLGFVESASAQWLVPGDPANDPKYLGGLQLRRAGGQTVVSVGGALFERRVKVTTATPEGPVVTRFTLPSQFHSPVSPPFELFNPLALTDSASAMLQVHVPDAFGVVYVEGKLVPSRGLSRLLESPPLPTAMPTLLNVRFAYQAGDRVLIEDRQLSVRGGEAPILRFDGTRAVAVPIRADDRRAAGE